METPWYAVQCRANQDARAETELGRQGYEVFRPKLRMRRRNGLRIESFFPRYLFIRLSDSIDSFAPVRSTRGVLRLVGWGGLVPEVPAAVIAAIRARSDEADFVSAEPRFQPGQAVRITDGPFHDLTGLFQACSSDERVVVLLNLLQSNQALSFPADCVVPA